MFFITNLERVKITSKTQVTCFFLRLFFLYFIYLIMIQNIMNIYLYEKNGMTIYKYHVLQGKGKNGNL